LLDDGHLGLRKEVHRSHFAKSGVIDAAGSFGDGFPNSPPLNKELTRKASRNQTLEFLFASRDHRKPHKRHSVDRAAVRAAKLKGRALCLGQYSSTTMIARTRVVCDGSAGSSEPCLQTGS
jgi:hypothetical protein